VSVTLPVHIPQHQCTSLQARNDLTGQPRNPIQRSTSGPILVVLAACMCIARAWSEVWPCTNTKPWMRPDGTQWPYCQPLQKVALLQVLLTRHTQVPPLSAGNGREHCSRLLSYSAVSSQLQRANLRCESHTRLKSWVQCSGNQAHHIRLTIHQTIHRPSTIYLLLLLRGRSVRFRHQHRRPLRRSVPSAVPIRLLLQLQVGPRL
jgi:hypothetical protein